MKTYFRKLPALIAAIFLVAFNSAFGTASKPQITPTVNYHVSVDTLASRVTWFGKGQFKNAFATFKGIDNKVAIVTSFIGTGVLTGLVASALHISGPLAFTGVVAVGVGSYLFSKPLPGVYHNGIESQIWINKILEYFIPQNSFLTRSEDQSANVNYNTINLAEAGVDPTVLLDNAAYPIDVEERTDAPLDIVLRRMRTKNTVVRDAIAKQLVYNQLESVVRGHRRSLQREATQLAAYSWTPQENSTYQPVVATDGKNIGSAVVSTAVGNANLLAFTPATLAYCKKLCDDMLMPDDGGRIFVMCSQHLADMSAFDALIYKQLTNIPEGNILSLNGFKMYFTQATPTFDYTTAQKQGYGSVPNANSVPCSFFYHESEVMRAMGTTDMFYRLRDPEQDGDIVGFSQRFVALPYRNKYQGAVYSGHA